MGWATAALVVGLVATLVLGVRALVGDRSRGRRRCPKCWYDMSATPPPPHSGLVCPECGKDAKREARLFKTRRRRWHFLVALVPLVVGVVTYFSVAVRNANRWQQAVPSAVLIAMSPWLDFDGGALGREYVDRLNIMRGDIRDSLLLEERARAWAGRVSRAVLRVTSDPDRILDHAWVLTQMMPEDRDSARAAVLPLLHHEDPTVVRRAFGLAAADDGFVWATDELIMKLAQNPDRDVQDCVEFLLYCVRSDRPGGPVPAITLADAEGANAPIATDPIIRQLAIENLGLCDPHERSRPVLMKAATDAGPASHIRAVALGSLTRLYPEDEEVRALLVSTLRDPALAASNEDAGLYLVKSVMRRGRRATYDPADLTESRRALYSDEVRDAILHVATGPRARQSRDWVPLLASMQKHPCFTPEERRRVDVTGRQGP